MASTDAPALRRVQPSPVEWLCFALGLGLCIHYAWLMDDAYVYFRYIDNWLLLDRGLVYNPGEYVEGYTSPLWLLILSGLRALGFGYWLAIRLLAALAFAGFWYGAVVINRRLASDAAAVVGLPVAYLCLNYAVLCYFSSGAEAPLLQLTAVGYGLFFLDPASKPGRLAVALSPLTRPELALGVLFCAGWLSLRDRRAALRLLLLVAVPVGGWLSFRVFYYADLLPATFYLKVVRDPAQGFLYLHDTLAPYGTYFLLLIGLVSLGFLVRSGESSRPLTRARFGMLGLALSLLVFAVWIGGDARHYRYLAFPFCLLVLALGGLCEWVLGRRFSRRAAWLAPALGLAVACFSASSYPRQLPHHPIDLQTQPQFADKIADAAHHRVHPELLRLDPWSLDDPIERRALYREWQASGESDPAYTVESDYLCWRAYQHFERWFVHAYGLTDGVLARIRSVPGKDDRPGHKEELQTRAREIAAVISFWQRPPAVGMYRAAVEADVAAAWMIANLDTLESLERRLYGPRSPLESLQLAFQLRDRVQTSGPGS